MENVYYSDTYNSYSDTWNLEFQAIPVNSTPDNLWILTENDNLIVSETGDPLVIY